MSLGLGKVNCLGTESLTGGSSLKKTDCLSLNSHWLPVAQLEVESWMNWNVDWQGLVCITSRLGVRRHSIPVMARRHYNSPLTLYSKALKVQLQALDSGVQATEKVSQHHQGTATLSYRWQIPGSLKQRTFLKLACLFSQIQGGDILSWLKAFGGTGQEEMAWGSLLKATK